MPKKRRPTPERFWEKVLKTESCWHWRGSKTRKGYGNFFGPDRKVVRAHRYSYELAKGPIPEGLELDHLCRNRACVRPDHLDPVTHVENVRRGESVGPKPDRYLSSCKYGHVFDDANTYIHPRTGRRWCRACRVRRVSACKKRRRAERLEAMA